MGSGSGLSQGVGSPDFRVISGLMWSPQREPVDPLADLSGDSDNDGIADEDDLCPDQPEDKNGVDDEDGCPDGEWTPTSLFVVEPQGALIAGSRLELIFGPDSGEWVVESGELTRALLPGTYEINVKAEGYEPLQTAVGVPFDTNFEYRLNMTPLADLDGRVQVNVTDPNGLPLNATVRVLGESPQVMQSPLDGVLEYKFPAGSHELVVSVELSMGEKLLLAKLRFPGGALVDEAGAGLGGHPFGARAAELG